MSRKSIKVLCSCATCRYSFEATEYKLSVGRKYCSLACYRIAQGASPRLICPVCQVFFETTPQYIRRGRIYCGRVCALIGRNRSFADRFWSRVDRSGECWLWTGPCNPGGYGIVSGKLGYGSLSHRVAWQLVNGPIPSDLFVLHNCPGKDCPSCVRPSHLWLGTHADNMRDAVRKGGLHPGEQHPRAKLTRQAVQEIRQRYKEGQVTHQQLADQYQVARTTVSGIIRGEEWQTVL